VYNDNIVIGGCFTLWGCGEKPWRGTPKRKERPALADLRII
jgi:hypothetical protein